MRPFRWQAPSIRSRLFHALFSHLCNSIVNFANGWKTMTQAEHGREKKRTTSDGKTLPLCDLNVKETKSICAVSLLYVFVLIRFRFSSSSYSLVFFPSSSLSFVLFSSRCYSIEFVCLFNSHFPCASRSFTPINLFRFHFAHITYLAVFNLFMLCSSFFYPFFVLSSP